MQIVLLHEHCSESHLASVKSEMVTRGVPVIRCIWSQAYGIWFAVEGCHRLRAALALGIAPVIQDVSDNRTVTIQSDGGSEKMSVAKLLDQLQNNAGQACVLTFADVE